MHVLLRLYVLYQLERVMFLETTLAPEAYISPRRPSLQLKVVASNGSPALHEPKQSF